MPNGFMYGAHSNRMSTESLAGGSFRNKEKREKKVKLRWQKLCKALYSETDSKRSNYIASSLAVP